MKTRRIHLQPDEVAEIVNHYGTSLLKATARFDGTDSIVVVYEQPDVTILKSHELAGYELSPEPGFSPQVPLPFNPFEGD